MSETQEKQVIGKVQEGTILQLNTLRQAAKDITTEIGQIEIRKARLIGSLGDVEGRAQALLTEVGKRLGVPEGAAWQVTPEGDAVVLPQST